MKLSPDERRVLAYIKKRLLQGQKTYGPLDLATAKKDWKQERVDEIADLLIYSAFEALKNDLPKEPLKETK